MAGGSGDKYSPYLAWVSCSSFTVRDRRRGRRGGEDEMHDGWSMVLLSTDRRCNDSVAASSLRDIAPHVLGAGNKAKKQGKLHDADLASGSPGVLCAADPVIGSNRPGPRANRRVSWPPSRTMGVDLLWCFASAHASLGGRHGELRFPAYFGPANAASCREGIGDRWAARACNGRRIRREEEGSTGTVNCGRPTGLL
jgi:hypothetical protein